MARTTKSDAGLAARRFYALIWKDFVVHKRHYIWTMLEITIPVLVCAMAILSNSHQGKPKLESERTFDAEDYERVFGDLSPSRHRLLVAPNTSFTRALVDQIDEGAVHVQLCNSEREMIDLIKLEVPVSLDQIKRLLPDDSANVTIGGVTINSLENDDDDDDENNYYEVISKLDGGRMRIPLNLDMSIRAKDFRLGPEAFPKKYSLGPFLHADHYTSTFFTAAQLMMSRAYMSLLSSYINATASQSLPTTDDIVGQRMPYPKYVAHKRLKETTLGTFVAGSQKQKPFVLTMDYCITVGFLVTAIFLVKRLVDERKSRVRDMLRLVGISDWTYYSSHMCNTMIIMAIQCAMITLLFTGHTDAPAQNIDSTLMFTVLVLYCVSSIMFVLALSTLFSSSTKAIIFTSLLWLGLPEVIDRIFKMNSGVIESSGFWPLDERAFLLLCMVPNFGLRMMNRLLTECDIYGEFYAKKELYGEYRAIWPNAFNVLPLYHIITVGHIMLALLCAVVLYALLIYLINRSSNASAIGLAGLSAALSGNGGEESAALGKAKASMEHAASQHKLFALAKWLMAFALHVIVAPFKLMNALLSVRTASTADVVDDNGAAYRANLAYVGGAPIKQQQQQQHRDGHLNAAFVGSPAQSVQDLSATSRGTKIQLVNMTNGKMINASESQANSLNNSSTGGSSSSLESTDACQTTGRDPKYFESAPKMLRVGVSIRNLCKTYLTSSARVDAVRGVSLDMFYSQILVLLGHNGAGKTTLIDIISGHNSKSGGSVHIDGYDIDTHPSEARRQVGFCPQFDVLFERLTVEEHLYFYGIVKGARDELQREIQELLAQSGLDVHKHKLSKALSGGYKRKLSLAIAMIAKSKVLILDEPTSGMDPESRRKVWDFLQLIRHERLILMTTHHMEEADALGDRIAVMSQGQVRCCGSALFLKRVFNAGYHLRISKSSTWNQIAFDELLGCKFGLDDKLENITPHELTYKFDADETGSVLPALFDELERNKERVGIFGFGITVSTMDDVFMRIGVHFKDVEAQEMQSKFEMETKRAATQANSGNNNKLFSQSQLMMQNKQAANQLATCRSQRLQGSALFKHHVRALVAKRCQHARKNWFQLLWILSVSLSCVASIVLLIDVVIFKEELTPEWTREMTLEGAGYGSDTVGVWQFTAPPSSDAAESAFPSSEPPSTTTTTTTSTTSTTRAPVDRRRRRRTRRQTNASAKNASELFLEQYWLPEARQSGLGKHTLLTYTDINTQMIDLLTQQFADFRERYVVGGERAGNKYVAWYNGEATHSLPISLNVMLNSILRQYMDLSIKEDTHPLKGSRISLKHTAMAQINTLIAFLPHLGRLINLVFLPFSLAFITSYFVIFPTHERVTKSKHLQLMTGVRARTFWFAHFLFDLLLFSIYTALVLAIYFVWDRVLNDRRIYFANFEHTVALISLVGLFIFAALPLAYIFSFLAKKPTSAFSSFCVLTILTGTATLTLVSLYELKYEHNASFAFRTAFTVFLWTSRLVPSVSLLIGLQKLFALNTTRSICINISPEVLELLCRYINSPLVDDELRVLKPERCCRAVCKDECYDQWPFVWTGWFGVNTELAMLVFDAALMWAILVLIESRSLRRTLCAALQRASPLRACSHLASQALARTSYTWQVPHVQAKINKDVEREQARIRQALECGKTDAYSLLVSDLTKVYAHNKFRAVDQLSFLVDKREFFGLLGVNGAGKSTTFKMLTGELKPTGGNAYIGGRHDVRDARREYLRHVGYCPQQDALISSLTGREMLMLFARLRGIPEHEVARAVDDTLDKLGLKRIARIDCNNYSGGNKRRLSVGMALIGAPAVVFLDEPTSGVDPRSRRRLWSTLIEYQRETKSSIVMTSHSMNECECLCDRVAIMVAGQFKVMGSIQYLRTKLSQGFSLVVKLKPDSLLDTKQLNKKSREIGEYMAREFSQLNSDIKLKDLHQTIIQYHIEPSAQLTWSKMLLLLEKAKSDLELEDYQITSDASLESIFLSLAKQREATTTTAAADDAAATKGRSYVLDVPA